MNNLSVLREKSAQKGVDALLVVDPLNQRYLSGFSFTDGYLLITKEKAYLITDFRYYEMALSRASSEFTVVMPEDRAAFFGKVFAEEGVRTLGIEGKSMTYAEAAEWKRKYPVEIANIGLLTEELRQIKTPEEIEKMQKAQDIADGALARLLPLLRPEMTELDVAVELEYQMRRLGSEKPAFETIAVSGDASALPHGTPRNVKLKPGFLTMDFGATYEGYLSDMTRTVVIGRADAAMKKLYDTVLHAQLSALEYLSTGAGVDGGEADKVARDIIDADYPGAFGHSLGHSVGLFIHETPGLSKRYFGRKLRAGEIVTVEPGIYLFGKYGCRIEDMVEIRENSVHNFAKSPKDLIEIV